MPALIVRQSHSYNSLCKNQDLWAAFLCLSRTSYMEWPTIWSKTQRFTVHFQKCFENSSFSPADLDRNHCLCIMLCMVVVIIACTLRMYSCWNHHLCIVYLWLLCNVFLCVYLCCVSLMCIYVKRLELVMDWALCRVFVIIIIIQIVRPLEFFWVRRCVGFSLLLLLLLSKL